MSYKQLQPILVANGGTSIQSTTPYAPICGGATSSTDPFQSIASAGISGQILTSSGASLPAFQAYGWDKTNTQVFSTNGNYTYTPTSGMVYVIVEAIGAGGGAGYASAGAAAWAVSAGGAAGGYTRGGFNAVTIGSSQSITIGLGGAGGIESTSTQAQNGGDTLFGSLLTGGGGSATNSLSLAGGGPTSGGTGSGGFLNFQGMSGFMGTSITGTGNYAYGGQGGSSMYGSGGQEAFISATSSAANGNNGTGNGSGGGGCACSNSTANGGSGTDGIIIITEFIL